MPVNKIEINKNMLFANENNDNAYKIFDSNSRTKWTGGLYPGYVDIELDAFYKIEHIMLETDRKGYCIFSVYSSDDGVNFSERLRQDSETNVKGYYEFNCDFAARFIRIFIKYNSVSPYAEIKNAAFYGTRLSKESATVKPDYPEDFSESVFNVPVTAEDTVNELHSLVTRTVGEKYSDSFIFEMCDSDKEFFEISDYCGKIKIVGNSGVNIAAGLNHYYKYFCGVHISQVGNNTKMPDILPAVGKTVHRETPFSVRYSYNYCALSYTMAFWDENDWQKELDWLALQGVNVVLDITAVEEVYRRFLLAIGYNMNEVKSFITGPAYYAWFNMANIYGIGGPLHDNFFKKHTDLARRNHLYMRKMGMQPVMQGYSGMVPVDIKKHIPTASVIPQGQWNQLQRPYMLKTDSDTYIRLARLFYKCQREVFGDVSHFYATDPFHEGGKCGRMKIENVGRQIMNSILENDPDGIWIIQSWGENPSKGLLDGIGKNKPHALILDLYAEKKPRWENFLGKEFLGTPWVYCMLNNFGGRMGLHGHLKTIANEIARAAQTADYMAGIGITPEATHSNPVIFDLFFETIWSENGTVQPVYLEKWLQKYAERRYGKSSESINEALLMLNDTVYNPDLNEYGEGAPESVVNARPSMKVKAPSTWGNNVVAYDKQEFEKAVSLFASEYDSCKNSEGYMFDLIDLLKQVLSNTAAEYQLKIIQAIEQKDLIELMKQADKFTSMIKFADTLLSAQKEFLLGFWLNKAKKLADGLDEFSRQMFEFNARALITTWSGSRCGADRGGLADYSNKQWAGLTKDFYLPRWQKWLDGKIAVLSGKREENIDWFRMENKWTWLENEYTDTPTEIDIPKAIKTVLEVYNFQSAK